MCDFEGSTAKTTYKLSAKTLTDAAALLEFPEDQRSSTMAKLFLLLLPAILAISNVVSVPVPVDNGFYSISLLAECLLMN